MKKKNIIIFSFIVLIFLAVGSYTLAQPAGIKATLLVTNGDVNVLQAQNFLVFNGEQQTNLVAGDAMLVRQGDTIEVAPASTAVLTMGDGASADLLAGSTTQVSEFFADGTNFRVRLSLLSGKIVNRVQHLLKADDNYEVRTPSSTASVRGTVFAVDVRSSEETFVSVDEGVVAVQAGGQQVLVKAGFQVTVVSGQPLEVQPQTDESTRETVTQPETAVEQSLAQPDITMREEAGSVEANTQMPDTGESVMSGTNQEPIEEGVNETVDVTETTVSIPQTNPVVTATPEPGGTTSVPDSPDSPQSPTAQPTSATAVTEPAPDQPTATTETILPTATAVPSTATSLPATATLVPPTAVPPPTDTPEPPPPPTEEPKVTLCHKGNTIIVDQSSVQAHLDHGDTLGPCP